MCLFFSVSDNILSVCYVSQLYSLVFVFIASGGIQSVDNDTCRDLLVSTMTHDLVFSVAWDLWSNFSLHCRRLTILVKKAAPIAHSLLQRVQRYQLVQMSAARGCSWGRSSTTILTFRNWSWFLFSLSRHFTRTSLWILNSNNSALGEWTVLIYYTRWCLQFELCVIM